MVLREFMQSNTELKDSCESIVNSWLECVEVCTEYILEKYDKWEN